MFGTAPSEKGKQKVGMTSRGSRFDVLAQMDEEPHDVVEPKPRGTKWRVFRLVTLVFLW